MNIQNEINEVFENIVKDIMFIYPNMSREVAEKSAVAMIRYPQMLIELSQTVKVKRTARLTK